MAVLENPPVRPGVADQSQERATVPEAEAHDDHDNQHDGEHAFAWPEAARIAFVALAAAACKRMFHRAAGDVRLCGPRSSGRGADGR